MAFSGAIIGMPFSLEGFAFFAEAIFLGIYLYGWQRVSPRLHLASGVVVAVSGALSAFFVTLANAWMNRPAGFELADGVATGIQPFVAMFPPGWAHEVVHVLLSCYVATGFAVAGIHAWLPAAGARRAASTAPRSGSRSGSGRRGAPAADLGRLLGAQGGGRRSP